jgi:hypothetical protein
MEFEPSYQFLIDSLTPVSSEKEAVSVVNRAILNVRVEKRTLYEVDDFIRICQELTTGEDRRIRTIGFSSITQARTYRLLKTSEKFKRF